MTDRSVRRLLRDAVAWGDAHVTFDKAVAGLPPRLRGVVPAGLPHSAWQLVEHIRLAQADILEFCIARTYRAKKWPDAYWPSSPSPKGASAWRSAIAAVRTDRRALQRLATTADLAAAVPNGDGQTFGREILLALDHTAYHVGQIVLVRRALGHWPD
ncbi:MAG TPA: DinB family protein [Vicinamibacterales bacterium]|nr:DinB family protein [Vicinamibacterales bacterium]